MNSTRLDTKLVAAAKHRSGDTNSFVTSTMKKIRSINKTHVTTSQLRPTNIWQRFIHTPLPQRMALGVIAAVIVSAASFTGYTYAIGSNPISVIKRWVEGDKIKIEYNGRQFEHGAARSYSDAAITALAEINTVTGLSFHAQNMLQTPKDGVEYVSLPASMNPSEAYQYPYLATIVSADVTLVTVHKEYLWGDKMNPSHNLNETISMPAASFRYFLKGEPTKAAQTDIGKLVMVFPDTSMRHVLDTKTVTKETNFFSFALSHDIASFKEVSATQLAQPGKDTPLYEPSWGGLSDICLNNGADICDLTKFSRDENQGLFAVARDGTMGSYNLNAIAYGEGVGTSSQQPENLISRNLQGKIVTITDTTLTIQTSSGARWHLAYSKANQEMFAQAHHSQLNSGDNLAGQVLESIYSLDNRTVDSKHIASLERY